MASIWYMCMLHEHDVRAELRLRLRQGAPFGRRLQVSRCGIDAYAYVSGAGQLAGAKLRAWALEA
eukprot:scaffold91357_cov36-Tisochrysis_lutea.AAC.2